jgi:hypothetical protein
MLVSSEAFQEGFRRLLIPLRQPVTPAFAAKVKTMAHT